MPADATYRTNTENIIKHRLEHVKNVNFHLYKLKLVSPMQTPDVNDLETKINCGQIEEVIIQVFLILNHKRFYYDLIIDFKIVKFNFFSL